jgi:spermidine synthase
LSGKPRRFDAEPAPFDGEPQPFCVDTELVKSLHFDLGETQSRMSLRDPDALVLKYTRTMMGCLLFNPAPERIAMIGLGGGSLAKFCHRHLPQAIIDVVEVNPRVLQLRDDFMIPPDDARLSIQLADGAEFVRRLELRQTLDLLLVDAYGPGGIPEHLCTAEFHGDCLRSLRAGGVAVFNLFHGFPDYERCVAHIRALFGQSLLIVADGDYSNDIVFAWRAPLEKRHLDAQSRPSQIPRPAWSQLAPAMNRVREAWRERAAGT